MKTAVYANVRTAHESWKGLSKGFDVAIRGGSVMGFSLVSFAVLNLYILIKVYQQHFGKEDVPITFLLLNP